jgi:hypothetical protein
VKGREMIKLYSELRKERRMKLMMFGWCDLGMGCPELGYVSLSELEEAKFPPFGLGVERDIYFGNPEFGSLDLL